MSEDYIYRFNYNFDKELLLKEAQDLSGYQIFEDPANKGTFLNFWKIKKVNSGYAQEIADYFLKLTNSKDIRPRFYIQEIGSSIDWHTDRNTLCSINFVLSGNEDPISFTYGTEFYNIALLNTQKEHAVLNIKSERLLFKLSIFDICYDNVKNCLKNNILINEKNELL
jgi:hypothetical protein